MPKVSLIRDYYIYDRQTKKSFCQIKESRARNKEYRVQNYPCNVAVKDTNISGMIRHVKNCHPMAYRRYLIERSEVSMNPAASSTKLNTNKKQKKGLLNAHVEIGNNKSFSVVDLAGFKRNITSYGTEVLNEAKVTKSVTNNAKDIKNEIIKLVSFNLVSVKVDCVTKSNKSFLGIHVQLYIDGNIILCTLPTVEIKVTLPREKLQNIILEKLLKYGVKPENIYSITVDNGANSFLSQVDSNFMLDSISESNETISYKDMITFTPNDVNDAEDVLRKLCDIPNNSCQSSSTMDMIIDGVRCPAEELHCAVWEALNVDKLTIINSARTIVKELIDLNLTYRLAQPQQSAEKLILDCPTRWTSTCLMLVKLFGFKGICYELVAENKIRPIDPGIWSEVYNIIVVLIPCLMAVRELEQDDVALTDLYGIMGICKVRVMDIDSEFAREMEMRLDTKMQALFSNTAFVSAIFLDPRYNSIMQDSHRDEAKRHLPLVYDKICKLEIARYEKELEEAIRQMENNSENLMQRCEELNANLKKLKSKNNIERMLREFSFQPRLSSRESVIQFWELNKSKLAELYKLASVFLQIPTTQVSIEKLWSQIRSMLNKNDSMPQMMP